MSSHHHYNTENNKDKDSMNNSGNPEHESVEEAVFRYVGEGLHVDNDVNDKIKDHLSRKNSKDDQHPMEHNSDVDDNNNINNSNNNNGSNNVEDNATDMSWYLRHDEDIQTSQYHINEVIVQDEGSKDNNDNDNEHDNNNEDQEGEDSIHSQSVAMAAVVAAYANEKVKKNKRSNDDESNDSNTGHITKKTKSYNHKKSHNGVSGDSNDSKKNKLHLAVDPELATLDDPNASSSGETQDQLVRKAIIETDSITQNPDFQQYLNTDATSLKEKVMNMDEVDNRRGVEDDIDLLKKSVEQHSNDIQRNHNTNHNNNLDNSTKQYAELSKEPSGIPKENMHDLSTSMRIATAASQKIPQDLNVDEDTQLLQNAATKASEIIGSSSTTQTSGKAFDLTEEAALDHFIEEYQRIKKFTRRETCERIWTNGRRKDDFWINICKVLPYRTRSSIYKHVRRRYHIFKQRGKWTPAEDQELAQLCIEKEGQWSEVGKAMGRMPEDCRDRWRNYIKCGENRASNKWTPEEEELLKNVIANMLNEADNYIDGKDLSMMNGGEDSNNNSHNDSGNSITSNDNERNNTNGENEAKIPRGPRGKKISGKPTFKDIINWTVVSERMGGTRSRIQCRYKWNKLIRKQAVSKIENITSDEKRWLLEKLRDLGFTEDSQIDWEELASLHGNAWTGLELKVCYEKMKATIKNHKKMNINEISKSLLDIFNSGNIENDKAN